MKHMITWLKYQITLAARWWIQEELQSFYNTAVLQNQTLELQHQTNDILQKKMQFIVERNHELGAYSQSLHTQLHGRMN